MGNKNNNNNKNKTRNNDEQQRQLREERERRRRDAGREDDAPVIGTQRLFAEPRRGANQPVDVNVGEIFASPAVVPTASSTSPANVITPEQVEAALAAASATALPDDVIDALLLSDDGGVDVSDGVQSYGESEADMDIDGDGGNVTSSATGNKTLKVHVPPKDGEVVVEDVRAWTPASQKDGSLPSTVRDIGIQADFGGASIERHRRYLRASRTRQRKRNLAKKRAMVSETAPPTPDTMAAPSSSLRQPGGTSSTSLSAPAAPVADNSRDRGDVIPAKARKVEQPPKKKELWWQTRKAARKEKKLSSQREADQVATCSGAASTPRRKIQLSNTTKAGSSGNSEVLSIKPEDLRVTIASRRQSRSHSRPTASRANSIDPLSAQQLVKSIVEGLSASLDRRMRRQSPSPQPSCSHHSSRRRSRYPSHIDEAAYRSFYGETDDEDDRSRSRSRSRSRGRSRQRQPPPARGKGKGKGKGRGK